MLRFATVGDGTKFGPYELIRRIAVGGMAEIFLAKVGGVAGFEKHLVLKLIHPQFINEPDFVEMLVAEAKLVVRLNHVNIAQVFDLGVEQSRYYIAMEYVNGPDVSQLIKRQRASGEPMPLEVAAYIVAEVCAGVGYAHQRHDDEGRPLGIIHRDISPQNVLVGFDGAVKVIDFGVAKARARAQTTGVGVIKGKLSYMSPEQANAQPFDHRSDIFAIGVLLYELITGRRLYDGVDSAETLRLAKTAAFLPPTSYRPDLPRELETIVLRAMARKPEARFATADAMRDALVGWLRAQEVGLGRRLLEEYMRGVLAAEDSDAVDALDREEFPIAPERSVVFSGASSTIATADFRAVPLPSGGRRAVQPTRELARARVQQRVPERVRADSPTDPGTMSPLLGMQASGNLSESDQHFAAYVVETRAALGLAPEDFEVSDATVDFRDQVTAEMDRRGVSRPTFDEPADTPPAGGLRRAEVLAAAHVDDRRGADSGDGGEAGDTDSGDAATAGEAWDSGDYGEASSVSDRFPGLDLDLDDTIPDTDLSAYFDDSGDLPPPAARPTAKPVAQRPPLRVEEAPNPTGEQLAAPFAAARRRAALVVGGVVAFVGVVVAIVLAI